MRIGAPGRKPPVEQQDHPVFEFFAAADSLSFREQPMKTRVSFFLSIIFIPGLTGCVDISVGSRRPSPPIIVSSPSPELNPADAATVAEIDAAARLTVDSSRLRALQQIAERPGLSPSVQVHLVNVAYRSLSFESSKLPLLRTIIANPAFCDSARQALVTQLNFLSFDSSKESILREVNQRLASPPGA
jgi:hypothetical protein